MWSRAGPVIQWLSGCPIQPGLRVLFRDTEQGGRADPSRMVPLSKSPAPSICRLRLYDQNRRDRRRRRLPVGRGRSFPVDRRGQNRLPSLYAVPALR